MRVLAATAIAIAIIMIIPSCGGPLFDGWIPQIDDFEIGDNANTLADWQDSSSGTGSPRAVDFNGMKVASGTSVIDSSHPGYIGINPPLGWSSEQLEGQLDHLSMWVDDVLVNPNLDANHEERWLFTGSDSQFNSDPFNAPDGWTIVKNDASGGSPSQHPQHGYFEVNGRAGDGYDNTIGWRFDANPSSSTVFDPSDGGYISQQIPSLWREIYSVEITFLYYVSSPVTLDDTVYIFTRFEGHVLKHHVFEVGDPADTWVQVSASVPTSFLQSLDVQDSLLFDIGLGTDVSGQPGAGDHEVYIDEIEMKLLVRPYPEQIDLRANGARVTGSTQGSVSPYVPDGSNRDCYSDIYSNGVPEGTPGPGGIDLNGYFGTGQLDAGSDSFTDWSGAFTFQVGLQFPLNVPQGAAVTSAILEIETTSGALGDPALRIYAADEDNVAAFTNGYPLLPDLYDWVNTSIHWYPTISAPGRYNTPDLSALIQEVVSRPGWQSGNYICIMIDYAFSTIIQSYIPVKGSTGFPQGQLAQLNVDFTTPDSSDVIPSFQYNKDIVIDHTKVVSDLENFPVLVDIWDADLHLDTQHDGDDIAFLYNGQVIPHEIDAFNKQGNGTHAHLSAWVNVPYVSSVQDTTIVMVYGDDDLGSQGNTDDVWGTDFSAVWHLSENPAQPQWDSTYADYLPHQPQIVDVTSPGSDGTSAGSMTSNDLVQGFIGDAVDLEGSNDYIDFGTPSELQMNGAFTVEAWFYADYVDNDYLVIRSGETNFRGWDLSFDDDPSISPAGWVMFRWSPDGVNINTVGYERVDTGLWYHVVGVFSPSEYARFYLNGELVGEMTSGVSASVNNPNRPVRIGRRSDAGTSYFDGIVDEVRISSVARSDAWIRTQYINQRSPEQFMTVGEEGVNFRFRKDITVDHNKVASDLTGFPVLIDIFDTDLRTDVQLDGDDIMFTSNGRSLPHEIEMFDQLFNSTHAHMVAWVKADLSSASDTVISMFYGNPSMGSQENPAEVWGNRYAGVWHLKETGGNAQDSTSYKHGGAPLGGVTQGAIGKIGNAYDFNGVDSYINFGDPVNGHLDFGTGSFTISIWLKIEASTGTWQVPLNKGHPSALDSGYRFETSTNGQSIRFQISDGISYESSNTQSVTFGAWIHFVARVDTSSNEMHLFKDGSYSGYTDISGIGSVSSTDNLTISRGLHLSTPVDGILDDIRISNIARSDGWIITEYNNQFDPAGFYSLGVEHEVIPLNQAPTGFQYEKEITIDNSKVDSDLSGFPVLIDIYDIDLKTDVQSDGDDIVFVRDGWLLNHEIELFEQDFNSSHAHLIAWVRTDLSSSSDTTISMYYGNPTAGNQENPTGVWDTSFAAVWHLSEDPAGTIFDSTVNDNDGIGLPISSEPTLQIGKIDGCSEFYGTASNDRIEAPHSSSLVFQSDMMVEAWIRTSNTDGSSDAIVAKWGDVGHRNYWLGKLDDSTLAFYVDNTQSVTAAYSLVNDGNWHHVVGVADAASSELLLYVDGTERGSSAYSGASQTGTSVIQIANNPGSVGFIQEWDGRIDEVRVSRSYRSPGWILTEFNNQNDPDTFYSVSAEIVPSAFGAYDYRKRITISTGSESVFSGYSASLTFDHGALVSAGKSQADGDDVRVVHWNGSSWNELDRVLDSDSSWNTGNAKIWFRIQSDIPVFSSDDHYYVYYGDLEAEFPPNEHANVFQFYDGFESGDLSRWNASSTGSAGDDISAVTNPPPNTGTYSARCEADNIASAQAMVWQDFADETSLLARTHIYLDPAFSISGGGHVTVMQYVDTSSGWQNQLAVTIRDDLTIYIWNAIAGEAYGFGTTSTLSTGAWHTLEFQTKISDTNGEVRFWLDGNLEVEETGKNIGTEGIDRYCAGFYWASPQTEPNIVYADDAFLRAFVSPEPTTSLGPELPQTIEFSYTKDIMVDHTKVDADLTDFPLLINIYDSDLKTKAQISGNDIIFKSGDIPLSHEIELFNQDHNSTHAHLVAWVKTDLSSTIDTTVTMHYGNSQAPNQEDPNGVWNMDYWGVWHLGETSGNALDSTSGGTYGTLSGNPSRGVAGSVGYAYDFDGADDYVALQSSNAQSTGTYSFWIYPQTFPIGPNSEVNILASADTLNRIHVYNNRIRVETATNDEYFYFSSSSITTDAWQHVVFVRAGDFGDLYVNGAWVAQVETVGANILTVDSFGGTDDISRMFDGPIDEVHISTTALSADWIIAEYRNQNDPASFYSIGPEEDLGGQESEFDYKKDIVIDHNKVNADLTDFPLLIDIYDTDLKTDVQADGDDIIFEHDAVTLPHEIELFDQAFNSTHAHLIAWAKVDLSSTVDTTITMYYGNSEISTQENPNAVWDEDYVGVWHLSEDPSGTIYDSTSSTNDGTSSGGMTSDDQIAGQIGGSLDFDATDDYVNVGSASSLDNIEVKTVSAWVQLGDATEANAIVAKGSESAQTGWFLFYDSDVSRRRLAFIQAWSGAIAEWHTADLTMDVDTMFHVTVTYNRGSTANDPLLYIDGVSMAVTERFSPSGTIGDDAALDCFIAKYGPEPLFGDGNIDEVRISDVMRSAEWIATEYNNQYDPSSFYSIGPEEDLGVQEAGYDYKKDIVIDHNKVNADLTDFPLLIDIYDTDLKTDVQADGDDIIFTIYAATLPHEIELFDQAFNATHAHLTAWVKVDLSSTVDTTITMYYGNPNIGSQESPSDVWNSNYVAVWHMNQDPSSSDILDSTSNGYDLSTIGFGSDQRIYDERSGVSISVDGIDDRFGVSGISGPTNDFTFQSWFKFDNSFPSGSDMHFFRGNSPTNDYPLMRFASSSGVVVTEIEVTSDPEESCTGNKNSWAADTWFQFAFARSMSAVRAYHYVNGSLDNEDNSADNANPHLAWNQLVILSDFSGGNMWGPGAISEFRILNISLSPDWIAAEYANQNDPTSFYSVGMEVQISSPQEPSEPSAPSILDTTGYQFTTNSNSSVAIGVTMSLGTQTSALSYADDLTPGTSFSIVNESLAIWTANVLVSPPPEIETISFELSYPEGEWYPLSVKSPSGIEKAFATDWTCFDGRLIVGSTAIDEYGFWQIQFQDRNYILDTQFGPLGGPYSSSGEFSIGEDIEFRVWNPGTMSSTIPLELTDPSGSVWYSGSTSFQGQRFTLPYNHRKDLTISHGNVASDLVNFPVLVDIYDTDLRTDVRTDGRDIAFAIGVETLTHELELFEPSFNSTHAHLVAWVKVPSLSGSSDTVISMYYGNPMAPIVYDSGPVWDSGYLGVWHLSESGTGAVDEYLDSSQYKHHGTGGEGNTSFVPTQVSGKIGPAQDFNNIDGYYDLIDCGDSPLWNINGYQITLEAWVQHDITPNTHVYGIMNHKGWYDGYSLFINYGGGSTLKPTFSLPGETHQLRGANDVTGGAWHHIVATYDGSLMRIYVDGVQDPNVVVKADKILPSSYEQGFWIGHGDQPKDRVWSAEWDGQIDEVRISDIVRSAGWIQTEYQNQYDPSSFYSISAEESAGYSESETITLDSSAPAGVWQASARYRDSGSDVDHRVGVFVRNFVVKHGASLNIAAPGDAVSDGISAKQIGEELYVEYELSDILNSDPISGATLTMNWTVSGTPTDVQLNDYGDGTYGRVLNTTDLGAAQRWRIELSSHHQFYNNATSVLFLDLSHETYLTYEPPSPVAYGDDFTVKITLRDSFNNQPLANAGFTSSGTLIGLPVDYGNGTYLLTIDSSALSVGVHNFSLSATPADTYLLSSSIDVQFNYRNVITEGYSLSSEPVEVPWGEQATVTIFWYDLDHSGIGIEGGTLSIIPAAATQTVDAGSGYYTLSIDMNSYLPGTYSFDVTISKANYEDTTISVTVIVKIHSTSISADYSPTTPIGTSTYFDLTFLDIDGGSIGVGSGNMSQATLDWGSGPQVFFSYGFWLDTSAWSLGVYTINITIYATTGPRYYTDATISIELEIRKLEVYMSWEHLEPFPNGDDFVIFVHLNVSEPGTPIDGTPINGLTQAYFSARNETGSQYTLESFTFLGDGRYQFIIDQSTFQEGDYTIVVYVDFLPAEDYIDSQTPVITFTYRPILAYLSSVDYPTVTTTYDTNVTIILNYVDIDNSMNITTGIITAEGASITWQHLGDGLYEVLIIVQGWNLGSHEVNITVDALSYQAKTLTFEVLVQIAYAYARSSISSIDLPVGDIAVFFVDYWDIIHDEPILGASITHNWTHALTVIWTGSQYRIELPSYDSDVLGSYFIMFNVSKGSNYQFGYFNMSLTLRTHYTEFRLGSAVEPTTYIGMVNVSVYYGDLDNDMGIVSQFVNVSVYGESGWIDSVLENDTGLGNGFYIVRFSASVLGESGIYNFTVYFNWTGAVQQFYNGMIRTSVNIIGEESALSLEDSTGPTPYLENMSYTYFYSELYSGVGISNSSSDVFIYVDFIGVTVDISLISILEGIPGHYTIEFNNTILTIPGVYTMVVYVNWSASVSPFYDNRTDTISVRVIPRSTVISVTPPDSTAYGVNATFSFSFDDVSDIVPVSIDTSVNMTVIVDLPDYTITYNYTFRRFDVSFNTSVLGASLGSKQFTINITWIGSPFYSNVTGRTVLITVTNRATSFDFATPTPSPFGENTTFTVTFMDITRGIPSPINDGVISLFNDSLPIPGSYYTYMVVGNGQYSIELNNTYFTKPGSYSLAVQITTSHFYYPNVTGSRTLIVQYRLTTLSAESVGTIAYNSSIPLVLHYNDLLSLAEIGNMSSLTNIEILNGSSWLFNSGWREASQDYLVTIQTHNQGLDIGRDYVLWIRFSYSDIAPFYLTAESFVSFRLRERTTVLDVTESPLPAPYLDSINFTVLYSDLELSAGIDGAEIVLSIDAVDLVEGTDYILQAGGNGIYYLSVNTTAIGPSGTVASILVRARWTSGAPYYTNSSISLNVRVTTRPANVNIISSPSQVRYLDNITFTFRYIDDGTAQLIVLTKNMVFVYSGGILLQQTDFMMLFVGNGYEISINSTIVSSVLVTNWNVTVLVDWASGVAPYYSDDASSVGATITNRIGIVNIGSAPTTPIGDNISLSISYTDEGNGLGIGNAIVEFDCVSPSGLVENADYWIIRGIGVNIGEYTILVDSTKLSGVGLYTFSLRLLWNPSSAPYYRNTTEVYLLGSVRLIQSLLTNDQPSPSTVPINDNVSVVLTFTDLDHSVPIVGALSNITVTYKSDGSIPAIWSIAVFAPGEYELVVNCTDAGSIGTNALVIRIDLSAFQFAEVQVPIQIRARQGEMIRIPPPDAYFGVQTYAIVELVDLDASSAPIADAILSLFWPEISSYMYIGNGNYNITLDTTTLDAGLYTLVVNAQKANYSIPDISISIRILSIPTEAIMSQTIPDVVWGENISIWCLFNDTRNGNLISGASVEYQIGVLGGSLSEGVPAGNYSFIVNSGNLPIATTYVVYVTASLNNYVTATGQITVNILKLDLELTIVDGLHDQDLHKGEPINITVFVRDVFNDIPLLGATVSAEWVVAGLPIYLSPVPGMDGYYTGLVATENAQVKTYAVVVRAGRTNYVSMSTSVAVRIRQIPTELWLDTPTSTYSSQEFNWSDTIRIGVYVLVPSLNESYPYSTGLSNCTVVWSLSGTFMTGELENGTQIGGPGYFYYDFRSWEHNATTYTIRIITYPYVGAFASSSNMTTLTIKPIETAVESSYVESHVWGWSGWVDLDYKDLLFDRGVSYADVNVDWEGNETIFRYVTNSTYQVWVNTSLVRPGVYPVVVSFWKQNYEGGTGVFTLTVDEIPTDIVVYAPTLNQVDDNVLDLIVPFGDILSITLFYNDTWYNQGIPNATERTAVIMGPAIPDKENLLLQELVNGNYSIMIDSSLWSVSSTPYRVVLSFNLENRSRATLTLLVTIINIPTGLTVDPSSLIISYGQTATIWVFYYDNWPGHSAQGIVGGFSNATSLNEAYVYISSSRADASRPGWYEIILSSYRAQGSAIVTIELSKDNHDSAIVSVAVSVEPSDLDILFENTLIYGLPIGALCIIGAILWSRLFSLPKLLREIRGMVKNISKGRIPKVPEGIRTRRELITELFNDFTAPIGLVRLAESMPDYSLATEVPEIEELIVQLSILTELTPEELVDFRADVSKMKLSEQVAFVKEVINQEAIRRSKIERKSMEMIIEETLEQARAQLAGTEVIPVPEPEVIEDEVIEVEEEPLDEEIERVPPEMPKAEDEMPPDLVSAAEIKEIRKQLVNAGIEGSELETIMEQVRNLPRELVGDLIDSILQKGGDKP